MKALGIVEMRQPTAAPDVSMPTLAGSRLTMKDLRGKLVLVNFWATWCVPCQWEMSLMETLYQAYKDRGFVILAISLDQGDPERVRAFVRDKKLTYPVALDASHEVARSFGITGLPATLLVAPDGSIKGVIPRLQWAILGESTAAVVALLTYTVTIEGLPTPW